MEMPDTLLTIEERLSIWQEYLFFQKEPKISWPEFLNQAGDAKTKRVIVEWLIVNRVRLFANDVELNVELLLIEPDIWEALHKWALGE